MKYLVLLFVSLLSYQSFACFNTNEKLICPGDTVISPNGFTGTVQGVNPFQKKASVRWTKTSDGFRDNTTSTFDISSLAVGKGCLSVYCVGDLVTSAKGFRGYIVGLNPYDRSAAVHWTMTSDGYRDNTTSTFYIGNLALGRGCVLGYCVGDAVMSPNGFSGKIVGVNPFTQSAAVHWTRTSDGFRDNTTSTFKIESLSIGRYCLEYGNEHRALQTSMSRSEAYASAVLVPGFEIEFFLNQAVKEIQQAFVQEIKEAILD